MTKTTAVAIPAIFTAAYSEKTSNAKGGFTGSECVVCGKKTRKSGRVAHVRADMDLNAIPIDADVEQDMGLFPVGPECSKGFPREYLVRMEIGG